MSAPTVLSHVAKLTTVDVDSMDPTVSERFTKAGVTLCDMTSNQAMVAIEAGRPERAETFKAAIAQIKATEGELDLETQIQDAMDLLAALFAKEVFPYLTGRVHTQTSPNFASDTEATINHAKKLVAVMEAHGIPKSRVCIKVPATPANFPAMKALEEAGIRTLATSLFSVEQAIAAHQAGCLYIAPWLNQLRVHFEPALWTDYADTAKEHPRMDTVRKIVKLYKDIGSKTEILPASIVNSKEAIALAALTPEHLTLPGVVLEQLISATSVDAIPVDPLLATSSVSADLSVDYLANGGEALAKAIEADEQTKTYLADALKIFGEFEAKTHELVRAALTA